MARHGYRELLASGASFWSDVRHGRRPVLPVPGTVFITELALSLRPQYFAFSSFAALAGAAAVPGAQVSWPRVLLAATVAGLGWGVGQLLNDLLDVDSDAVNAPGRAIVAGRLPAGPALSAAIALGVIVAVATALVHPRAWLLAGVAVALLLVYNAAKRFPAGGNVAHGAVMAVAAAIGVLAVQDRHASDSELRAAMAQAAPSLAVVAATAAWYLQSNYEKDRLGDQQAGYVTSATIISVRASALFRAAFIVFIGVTSARLARLPDLASQAGMSAGVALGLWSTLPSLLENSDQAALRGYRRAVNAALLCLLALAEPLLGVLGSLLGCACAFAAVHWAFSRESNP